MSDNIHRGLDSVADLSEVAKPELVVEKIRQTLGCEVPELSDNDFALTAETHFLELDMIKSRNDRP